MTAVSFMSSYFEDVSMRNFVVLPPSTRPSRNGALAVDICFLLLFLRLSPMSLPPLSFSDPLHSVFDSFRRSFF